MSSFTSVDAGYLLLRLATGILLFAFHGFGKLVASMKYLFGGAEWKFVQGVEAIGFPIPAFFALAAAFAESIAALFLAFGLFTRPSAALVAITMGVAMYRHATTDMRLELAAIYFFASLFFVLSPPHRYSLDRRLFGLKKR